MRIAPVTSDDPDELERLVLANTPRFRRLIYDAAGRIQADGGLRQGDVWRAAEAQRPPF